MDTILEKLNLLKNNMPDLLIKEIKVKSSSSLYVVNLQTVCSSDKVNEFILSYFKDLSIFNKKSWNNFKENISYYIPSINYLEIKESEIVYYLLNGFTILLYDNKFISFETKAMLDRGITEPTSEPVIKGPKDSFNESYNTNIGLIRKRVKDENLFLKEYTLGEKTKSKVGMIYLDNVVDKDLLKKADEKISSIKSEKILDSFYIKALVKKENKTMFPTILSTEKPDEVSKAITEGKIAVVCENSPTVILIPTFFLDFFHNSEDSFQKPFYSILVKGIRLLAFFLAILTPGIFLALVTHDQQILPTSLLVNFAMQRSAVPFPAIIEAVILTIVFEILYEGDSRTPTTRGTTLSVLGALVLGDAAVQAGVVSTIMVIIIAITSVSSLLFTFFDLQSAIRFYRYFIMVLASIFGILGLFVGTSVMIINLCSIKSFGKPYLIPYVPFFKDKSRKERIKKGLLEQNIAKD